jgi:hypothetical protein
MLNTRVDKDVLYIDMKSPVAPADWDAAKALMARIADPAHWLPTSALSAVDYWSVRIA